MTPTCFDEITTTHTNASLSGTFSICWRKGFRLTSDRHVKITNWWRKYFFVRVSSASVLDVDKEYRTDLAIVIDRFIPVVPFPEDYTRYKDQLRRQTEVSWSEVLEQQKCYWCSLKGYSLEANEDTMDVGVLPSLFEEEDQILSRRVRVERSIEADGPAFVTGPVEVQAQLVPEDAGVGTPDGLAATGGENVVVARVEVVRADGIEGESHVADAAEVVTSDATGEGFSSSSLPYFRDGEFSFKLSKDNPHGFEFMWEAEIVALARLEQRVAYKRTKLVYDYKRRLASAYSGELLAKNHLVVAEEAKTLVEKERDEARAEVEEFKKALRLAKREKRVQRLKTQLEESELEGTKLRENFEATSSSLQARDSELELSWKAEADLSSELDLLRKRYEDMVIRDGHELVRLRRSRSEYLDAERDQFARLSEESLVLLAKLRDYLAEEEAKRKNFLLMNQLKGIFDTLKTMERRYGIAPPNDFVEVLRKRKNELEAWLASRSKLSYVASDFELPDELGVAAIPEVSSRDEEAGRVEDEHSRGDQGDGEEHVGDDEEVDAANEQAQD
ncbi:unnamed protein product [Cochlearia groenlandica]